MTTSGFGGSINIGGAFGMIGAKGANREFKRFLQIEKSLAKVFKREIKKGIKAGFSALINKGKKFFGIALGMIRKAPRDIAIYFSNNMLSLWFGKEFR